MYGRIGGIVVALLALQGTPLRAQAVEAARVGIAGDSASAASAPAEPEDRSRRRPLGQRVLRGAGIGYLAGFGIGAVSGYAGYECGSEDFCIFSRREEMVLTGLIFGAIGSVIGGVVGAASGGEGEKQAAAARLHAAPSRSGRITLSTTLVH